MSGARELKTGNWTPCSKWLDKIQGLHIFCVTKENWNCHHVSLKQSCLPAEVLFPWFRGRQAQQINCLHSPRSGSACPAPPQLPTLSPKRLGGSISSLTASLLLFLLLCTNKNFQRRAKGSWPARVHTFVLDGKISQTVWGVWVLHKASYWIFPHLIPLYSEWLSVQSSIYSSQHFLETLHQKLLFPKFGYSAKIH